jgi:hypothetical protein
MGWIKIGRAFSGRKSAVYNFFNIIFSYSGNVLGNTGAYEITLPL